MQFAKLLIVMLALLALPLRGHAGLTMAFCDSHHGVVASSQEIHHAADRDATHRDCAAHEDGESGRSPASVCSLCAACCVNASLAPDSPNPLAAAPQATARIPFHELPVAVVSARPLDRPPLSPLR